MSMAPNRRLKMKQWLTCLLDKRETPGIQWEDEHNRVFKINWKHGSRHGYAPDRDAFVFKKWAEYTGKFDSRSCPDPKRWKANFRCALNSLKDVRQLTGKYNRGAHAFRLYQFVNHSHIIRRQPIKTENILDFNSNCSFRVNKYPTIPAGSSPVFKKELSFYATCIKEEPICHSPEVLTPPHTPEDVISDTTTNQSCEPYLATYNNGITSFAFPGFEEPPDHDEIVNGLESFGKDIPLELLENCNTALVNFNEFEEFFLTAANEVTVVDAH
ncbi:interferon regulatory factor 1 [Chamberlinius hualienensis]